MPEIGPQPQAEEAIAAVRTLLSWMGDDPERPALRDTPSRVAESLRELTAGSRTDVAAILAEGAFEADQDQMVLVSGLKFHSLCEHHLLPFFGQAHVAYLPQGRLVGLSKLARAVAAFSRRLQVQERMTEEIAQALDAALGPRGVGVVVEAEHLCMSMRGVGQPGHRTVTVAMTGRYRTDPGLRTELLGLIRRQDP